jgi:hypothetical protein
LSIGGESGSGILPGELGDDRTLFRVEVDYVGVAVAALIGTVGDFVSVRGELWAVPKSGVLRELAGIGSVDI